MTNQVSKEKTWQTTLELIRHELTVIKEKELNRIYTLLDNRWDRKEENQYAETFYMDAKIELEQYIKMLLFRRRFYDMNLDKIKIRQNGAIEQLGNVKDINNANLQITSMQNDDAKILTDLYLARYDLYNERIKISKEQYTKVFGETFKETYSKNYNPTYKNQAVTKFNVQLAKDLVKDIDSRKPA